MIALANKDKKNAVIANNKMKKLTLKLIWGMIIFFCLSVVPHKYERMRQE